jgi:hypothetical protein
VEEIRGWGGEGRGRGWGSRKGRGGKEGPKEIGGREEELGPSMFQTDRRQPGFPTSCQLVRPMECVLKRGMTNFTYGSDLPRCGSRSLCTVRGSDHIRLIAWRHAIITVSIRP